MQSDLIVCWRSIGFSISVWVDVRLATQAKTKLSKLCNSSLLEVVYDIVGHFDDIIVRTYESINCKAYTNNFLVFVLLTLNTYFMLK